MVRAFHHRISIIKEGTSTGGACTHSNHIFRVSHLVVQSFQYGSHFVDNRSGDNDHVSLAGSGPCHFKSETAPVIFGRGGAHHFNSTATCSKNQWPQRVGSCPIDHIVQLAH